MSIQKNTRTTPGHNYRILFSTALMLMTVVLFTTAQAQECKIEKASQNAYLVNIDGKNLIAVPKEEVAELQILRQRVAALEKDKAILKAEVKTLTESGGGGLESAVEYKLQAERTAAAKDREMTLLYRTVELMEKDAALADEQISKLKACCLITPDRNLSFHVGLGATGSDDTEAAALLGVGYRQWRLYGFLQENNSGLLLGYQF